MGGRCVYFLAYLLLLLLLPWDTSWSEGLTNKSQDLMRADVMYSRYDFAAQDCKNGFTEDTGLSGYDEAFGPLNFFPLQSSCLDGIGMVGPSDVYDNGYLSELGVPSALSEGTADKFVDDMYVMGDFEGFSIEMWLRLGTRSFSCATGVQYWYKCWGSLLTIGNPVTANNSCGAEDISLMITYNPLKDVFRAHLPSDYGHCVIATSIVTGLKTGKQLKYPFHLVFKAFPAVYLNFEHVEVEWHINGTFVSSKKIYDLDYYSVWNFWGRNHKLQLFDHARDVDWWSSHFTRPFLATAYRVGIYADSVDISTNWAWKTYLRELPGSLPYVYDASIQIPEDGEAGSHYDDPAAYSKPFPFSELELIYLSAYDSDLDAKTPTLNGMPPRFFVSKLPLLGVLVSSAGEEILTTPFEVLPEDGNNMLGYRSFPNDFSIASDVYATFEYYAIDGDTGNRSTSNATVSISVESREDPPEAIDSAHVVYAGTKKNRLPVNGTDQDPDDYVTGAEIVSMPTQGRLFEVRHALVSLLVPACLVLNWSNDE